MNKNKSKKMLLPKIISVLAITLFSVIITNINSVQASGFKYSDFDWDKFYEIRKDYWDTECKKLLGCDIDRYLNSQKSYYKKLYKTLAKYERNDLFINDNLIIETSFFFTQPSEFGDDGEYANKYMTIFDKAVRVDDVEADPVGEADADYFENEKDTINVLVKNAIAYTTECYGIYGSPKLVLASDGSSYEQCDEGSVTNINGSTKCADKIATNELGYWQYFVSKLEHGIGGGLFKLFLGKHPEDEHYNECANTTGYDGGTAYLYLEDPHVSYDKYFDFLAETTFFDSRVHLNFYFQDILDEAKVDCLRSESCERSLEATGKYDDYEEDIKEARLRIIRDIIETLHQNGQTDVSYAKLGFTESEYKEVESNVQRKSLYWPIGSSEIEEENGIKYADQDPESTDIVSYYGVREGSDEKEFHYGIDIKGVDGETNVISVFDGTIQEIISDCSDDSECNGGYGNAILISHSNGDYSYYAHLASIDEDISIGDTVKRGQVIGKVGSTGDTDEAILHFEYRIGGNSTENAVNPLDYVSKSETRPEGIVDDPTGVDFSVACTSLSREEYIAKVRVYCGSGKYCPAIMREDPGQTYDLSLKYGVNPEVTLARANIERTSAGYNYWGIGYWNGNSTGFTYSSYDAGVKSFASTALRNGPMASDMMSTYGYIGDYWFNPGSWGLGGCIYAPYMYPNGVPARVTAVCGEGAPKCEKGGVGNCTRTTPEDVHAYSVFLVKSMAQMRYSIFGLSGVSSCRS